MQNPNTLVLEIMKQEKGLAMSLFEQEDVASTLRQYSQVSLSFLEVDKICQEVVVILNRLDKNSGQNLDLIHNLKKAGHLLWDHLLTRLVKDRLKKTQNLDLVLSLDEELISIPWELLYTGEEFLCLKFNLGRVVRTKEQSEPLQYRSPQGTLKMLILANPTQDLKSAYAEGISIKNQLDKKRKEINIDFKSTRIDTLYVKKSFRDYDIVHFAGHCEYDIEAPKNSGWVLNDGRFTTQDIHTLGETASLPTLVFSNGCYSAKLEANPMDEDYQKKTYSLASAFLFSGVRHYIGTIRKIEDPVSLSFAKEFYTQLISGKSVGEGMRLSRLKLANEYGMGAVFWASYLLYGDPNFVLFKARLKLPKSGFKKNILFTKKRLPWLIGAISIISICIYLYLWLPSVNPSTYYLFLKSKNDFLKGKNQEVIMLSNRIINTDPLFLSVYPLLGDTYQRLGDRENAIKYYFEYILNSEKKGDKKNLASAYIGLGWVYHLQGEYLKAMDFYNQALNLSRENKDKLNEADVLGKIAVWYMDKEDYDKALELLTKSAEINRQRQHIYKHKYNLACDYFNLGLLFTNKDDFVTAREFYDKSFDLFNKLKLRHELSDYYFNIGEIYSFQKEYQKAADCYKKGLAIDQSLGHKPNMASAYNALGMLYVAMDQLAEAEEFFQQSIKACKEIDLNPELASVYYNLGLLYKQKRQKNKAREYFRQAQDIYRLMGTPEYQKIKQEFLELDAS